MKIKKNLFKYFSGLLVVISLRLIPHPPNVEPIMSTMMPFAKKWGRWAAMIFCAISIVAFDLITNTLGVWSLMTIGTYALLGFFAGYYFKSRKKLRHYVIFSIIGTLIYDAITGIGTGMIFFHQTFFQTFYGQIPFTLIHLGSNIILAAVISPMVYRWILDNPWLEISTNETVA